MKVSPLFAALLFVVPTAMRADFTYNETTQITGGSLVGMMKAMGTFSKQARQAMDPIESTVSIQGNRMARINAQRTEIIDLDKETITTIDHVRKQYKTMTFQQMKEQLQEAAAKAREQKQTDTKQTESTDPSVDLSFEVKVRNTGATKDIAGLNASESILSMAMDAKDKKSGQTGAMAITNDMWLAPEIPGYDEVREFNKRFAEKLGTVFSESINPAMLVSQPGAGKAMADMTKEVSKLKGVPVQQIMRMGSTVDGTPLPAASEAPLPQTSSPEMPSAGQVAKESASSAATSAMTSAIPGLGSFGGFGHKKKAAEPAPEPAANSAPDQKYAVLIESNTQMTGFSQGAVDASKFEIPAGYKQLPAKIAE